MRARSCSSLLIAVAWLFFAPAAPANVANSSNWAGYAVHRSGVAFRQVSATWTQPDAACAGGQATYSAAWVGLGGYSEKSHSLEQAGTELDCSPSGQVVSSVWYELVPGPSRLIALPLSPGDVMHVAVTVVGHRVTIDLENMTQHVSFRRTVSAQSVDVSSAEWIVEAPSECVTQVSCQTLPLADFGRVNFASVSAVSARGRAGSVLASTWARTKIKLTPGGQRFALYRRPPGTAGVATPSAPHAGGTEFDVTYSSVIVGHSSSARASALRSADLRH